MTSPNLSFPLTDATFHRLDNGLEVIVKETPGTELVSVQAWVRTGSLYEADLLGSGVSHLVEHLVFKGAGGRGPTELAQAVQSTGGYLNAYTSFDRTVYWVDTLKEGFATALDVVGALVSEATFPEEEYEREKDVIRREMDMGKDDPGRSLGQLLFSTVYQHHPYREPVIGRLELFNQVTRDKAFGYYQQRYIPDRTFLVIAGDVDTAEVLEQVGQRLGTKANRMLDSILLPEEPVQTGRRVRHEEFTTELTKMELAWRVTDLLHPDTPALEVLGVLLGQGHSSRLHRQLREKLRLVHEIGAGAYTPTQGGLFYIGTELDAENREAATAAILEAVADVQQDGVTHEEVLKARRMYLADQLGALTTTRGMASDLGSNWMAAGNLDFSRSYLESIDQVTPADVQRVAQTYLVEKSLNIVSLNPRGSLTKTRGTRGSLSSTEVKRHVFENGLTLLVKEDSRLPIVHLHAALRGGLLAESDAKNGLGRLMARTLIKGAAGRDGETIMESIESRGGSLGADSGANSFSCSATVLTPDLELGLELWSDCLLRPHFAEAEVGREKDRQLAALKAEEDSLSFIAFREVRQRLFGSHPYHLNRNGTVESIATLDASVLREFHKQHLVTGNAVLAVYGDVKFSEVVENVGGKFAYMATGARQVPTGLPEVPTIQDSQREIEKDKNQAVLAIAYPTVDMIHPDRTALDLIDEACSDMASRLFVRIREELGLAYSVGCSQIIGMAPGAFIFQLSTSPAQLDFAHAELAAEIAKLAAHGLTDEEISRARMSLKGKMAMQAQSNAAMAEVTALDELYGFGIDYRTVQLQRIKTVTPAAINEALQKYLTGPAVTVRVKGVAS